MPSSFTERNRYTLQATGEGANVWGAILNEGAFDLIDASMDGVVTISTTPVTLSTANGSEDQARNRFLNYTGTSPGTITIPSVEKWYIVRAATQDCTITNGSASLTVTAGGVEIVITDAASIWRLRDAAMATKAYVNQTAFNANSGILPGQGSGIVGFLQTDNGATAWRELTVAMIDGLQATLTDLQDQIDGKEPIDRATVAEFRADSAAKLLASDVAWDSADTVTITYASTVALDFATFINAAITLTGNITFNAPTNATLGKKGRIRITQDGTGSRTATFNSAFKFANGSKTLTTTAGASDYLYYDVVDTGLVVCSLVKNPS